jgi:exosortase D (VPLPA-CTERM-specific)
MFLFKLFYMSHNIVPLRRIPYLCVLLLALAITLLFYACIPVFAGLSGAWQTEEYSHGFMIPAIAFFIGWHRLTEQKPRIQPSWWGVPILGLAALMIIAGRLSAFEPPAQYGLLLALVGLCLAMTGTSVTRTLAPALTYLIFAVPLPRLIYVTLSQDLQLISSTLGALPLDLIGIPVFQDGNIIDLGGIRLQVVEACSGLRYLFPLMSFGFLIAYLMNDKMWKRVVVFLSTIPITIFMNALRIAVVGVTVDLWGKEMASGFLHDFEGWTLFLGCIAVLMLEVWILGFIGTRGTFRYHYFGLAHGTVITGDMPVRGPSFAALGLLAAMAVFIGMGVIDTREEITPPRKSFSQFNENIGDWQSHSSRLDYDVLKELQLSDYWLADYTKDNTPPVNFYIAYYASQRVGAAAHSPANCIPGGGWRIVSNVAKHVILPNGVTINLSRLLIQHEDAKQLVYYWFDERGRTLTEQYGAKWYLLWDSIFMHRTDGAMIRLVTSVTKGETEDDAEHRLNEFLSAAYPEVRAFVPGATTH